MFKVVTMKKEPFDFTENQFKTAFNDIYQRLTSEVQLSNKPKAFILGGQPGAGKTTIQQIIIDKLPNTVIVNGDEYRKYHPHFYDIQNTYGKDSVLHTQSFANKVVEILIDKLSDEKYNLIIEGTLRRAEVPINTCNMLKAKGYKTELSVMAVSAEVSWQGTLDRYNKMLEKGLTPRATPKESHDIVVENIAKNVGVIFKEKCFDNITLYNREKECLYDMKNTPDLNPSSILHKVVNEKEKTIEQKKPSILTKLETAKKEASQSAPKQSRLKSLDKNI